jgi:hypothetical protein
MLLHLWMAQAAAASVNGWLRSGDSPGGVDSQETDRTQWRKIDSRALAEMLAWSAEQG